jgi:hypothetical protein
MFFGDNNYRVIFGGKGIDYRSNFKDCRLYYPVIQEIFDTAECKSHFNISYIWFFFEPYVEITWIDDSRPLPWCSSAGGDIFLGDVKHILKKHGIDDYKVLLPSDGVFFNWFGLSDEEKEINCKMYAQMSQLALLFFKYQDILNSGLGDEKHYMRMCHVLANQLGMNYDDEFRALIRRAILANLFWSIGDHQAAVDAYEKITNTKYLDRDD